MAIEILLNYLKENQKTFKITGEQFELYNVIISSYDITQDSLEIWLTGSANGRVLIDISNLKEAYFNTSYRPVKTPEEMSDGINYLLTTKEYKRANINFLNEDNEVILGIIDLAL
ncbi:hypothetical protein [Bacillus wiedmannii]|uniref:hypothetical protein n=1 Tax=Bacillus wiedmannii TaxID=1890302 RepID=UPI000BF41290|nr:hypothetical protein [Bacillus wiedmannii]PEP15497.1 hypothetical protein CN552_12540 [Bacillus wiedmannii]